MALRRTPERAIAVMAEPLFKRCAANAELLARLGSGDLVLAELPFDLFVMLRPLNAGPAEARTTLPRGGYALGLALADVLRSTWAT